MLIEFVGVSDTGHVESLGGAYKSPKSSPVSLGDDVRGDAVAASVPSGRDLSSNKTAELCCLGNEDSSTLLELDKPLATFASPDVTLVSVLVLVLLSLYVRNLKRFEVVNELDLLMEDLLFRVVSSEEFGF